MQVANTRESLVLALKNDKNSERWEEFVNQYYDYLHYAACKVDAATNFCANLDPAILRRFTFKLEFDYLDDAGKKAFFERMFRTKLTDAECAELATLGNLAPGDFRTVRQEAFYLDEETSNADLIDALRAECLQKRDGGRPSPVGFAA